MTNFIKRFLALALAVFMVVGLMPLNVLAEEVNSGDAIVTNEEPAPEAPAEGEDEVPADGEEEVPAEGEDQISEIAETTAVAKIGDQEFGTLADALAAANAGDTIVLLADTTEDVTISKVVTIDGAGKTYTGAMTLKADTTIRNVNFDGKGYNGYAITTRGAQYLTIEGCTAKNYGYGFVQLASATALTTIKNVTASNMNYGVKIDYSGAVVLENVNMTANVAAVLNSNYGEKTVTIKDSYLNILGTWTRNDTIKTTYVFEGANTVGKFVIDKDIDLFKLADVNSTLTAPNDIVVTTDVEGFEVKYENGTYKAAEKVVVVEVATKADLTAAIAAAKDGDTIRLTADIDYGTDHLKIEKAIILDLGGKTLTTRARNFGIAMYNGCSVTNGKLNHAGTVAAIKVWNAKEISNLEIDVTGTSSSGNAISGIVIQENAAGVAVINNVTIHSTAGQGVANGIETYNCGNAASPVIGSMVNVTIKAVGTAMNISAPCGTATGCTFEGGKNGIELWIKGTYSASLNLVDCDVTGGVYAHDEFTSNPNVVNSGTLTLTADAATSIDDVALTINHAEEDQVKGEVLESIIANAVAKADGNYYTSLKDAVAAGGNVILLKDVTLGEKLTISGNVTISGNATITRADTYTGTLFEVAAGATLTLDGGLTIDGGNAWSYTKTPLEMDMANGNGTKVANHITPAEGGVNATASLIVNKGTLNANKVTIQNSYSTNGVSAIDCGASSVTTLNGATMQNIAANRSGAVLYVGGADAVLTIKGETKITGNFGISNGGIIQNYGQGTTVNLEGGLIANNHVGNSGTLYASYSGNANKINTFNMSGGIITQNIMEGYGPVYIHTNTIWNMTGGEISNNVSFLPSYVRSSGNAATISGGKIVNNEITGVNYSNGYYATRQDIFLGKNSVITGGTFTQNVSQWLAEDYKLVDNGNGTYGAQKDPTYGKVAEVNGTYFESLTAAIAAANAGDTITVIADHELVWDGVTKVDGLPVLVAVEGKTVTIDLNGKNLTGTSGDNNLTLYAAFAVNNDGVLTLKDSVGTGSVEITGSSTMYSLLMAYEYGANKATKLIVEGGSYYLENAHDSMIFCGEPSENSSNIVYIKGGSFTLGNVGTGENGKPWIGNVVGAADNFINVSGGTFNADINRQFWSSEVVVAKECYVVNNGNGTWTVKEGAVAYILTGMLSGPHFVPKNIGYATLADAIAAVDDGDVVIELLADATFDYNARDAYGAADTTSITINGNGHILTLNQKNSDWASIGLANPNAKLVLNNMTIEKTGYGDTTGAWNTHAIIFSCNVEMNNVTVNNSVAVQNGATLNNVTINEAGDFYGLWINGNGQSVTVNGGAINATKGRGIKIADQYINAPASVTLNVTGTKFTTAKKAAVLVSSKAGAAITASNVDISNVAADTVNFVWVDSDWSDYYNNVTVTGCTKALEDAVIKLTASDGTVKGYFKTIADAVAAAQDGDEVVILAAGTYKVPANKNITITGAVEGVKFDMSKAVGIRSSMTFNNVTFEYGNANYVGLQHAGTMVYNNCTFNGQVFLYGQSETFNNCTFNQNSANAYNVWTYGAKEVAFNNCTFNSVGKSVLIYAESASISNKVTVTGSTFKASAPADGKAAIEMDSSLTSGIELTISNSTATGFGTGNVSGNSLWNNKKGNNTDANNDITVVVDGQTVLAPVTFVAKIGEIGYTTLQAAVDAAVNGSVVTVLKASAENITVTQKPGVKFTIDGNEQIMTGTITVNGKSSAYADAGLTIKDFDFDAQNTKDACIKLGGSNATRYTSNVTVIGCKFKGADGTVAAIKNYTGGCKNLTVTSCTAKGMHSLVQVKGVNGIQITDVTIDCKNGIAVGTSTNVVIRKADINAKGYGIRADGTGAYNMTVADSIISAKDPIVVRTTTGAYELTVKDSKLTGTSGYGVIFTAGDDGTYEQPTGNFDISISNTETKIFPESVYVAEVNGVKYLSLAEAIKACTKGETVKVLQNITYTEADVVNAIGGPTGYGQWTNPSIIYVGGTKGATDAENKPSNVNAVIDLNGHTITNNAEAYLFLFMDNCKITFTGEGTVQGTTEAPLIWVTGTETVVTIESGKYTSTYGSLIWATHSGDLVIKGGDFSTSAEDASSLIMRNEKDRQNSKFFITGKSVVTVTGGTFHGFNPEKMLDDSKTPAYEFNAVHKDYIAVADGNVYTVIPYIKWVKAELLAGRSVKLDRDIVLNDISYVEALPALSNGNGKYCGFDFGNGAFFNVIGGDVTFDLNGHSITYDIHDDAWCNKRVVSIFYATDKANLTITDSVGGGKVDVYGMASAVYSVAANTKVTIEGGTWTWNPCKTCGASNVFLYASHGGELYITGGTFVNNVKGDAGEYMILSLYSSKETTENWAGVDYDSTKVEISGGTFHGYNPGEIKYMDNGNGNKETMDDGCAPGYAPEQNDDGTWTVAPNMIFEFHLTDKDGNAHWLSPLRSNDIHSALSTAKVWYDSLQGTYNFTLNILESCEIDEPVVVNFPMTIDLNGNTLTGSILVPDAELTVKNGSIVNTDRTVSAIEINAGKLTLENVNITSARHAVRIDGAVDATIKSGKFMVAPVASGTYHAVNVSGAANVTIVDGTFVGPKGTQADSGAAVKVQKGATVTIEGGNFSGGKKSTLDASGTLTVTGGTYNQDPTAYVAKGYEAVDNGDGTWTVVEKKIFVAQIGETGYESLTAAIAAAKAGDTIVLLADITEDVTVDKAVTIDGAGKTYTGKMTLKADTTIKNVNFDGKGYNGYAIETRGAQYLTIEGCNAKNYGFGFVQLASATALTTIKNVTVSNMNYGVKIDYSGAVVLESVNMTANVAAVLNSNYGEKTVTIKDSKLNILGTWVRNNTTKTTFLFEGANTVGKFITEDALDNFKLADVSSTLTAPEGKTVTTDVEGFEVKYENGTYKLVEKVELFNIQSSSIVLGNELAMYFYVANADLEGTDYVAVVTKHYADGRESVTVEIPFADWEETSNNRMRFKFDGIAAKEMNDSIEVVIKVASSEEVASEIYTDSIRGYIKRGFDGGKATGELATMLMDMLNYGAAAQRMFNYDVEHLANADMDAYQKYATQDITCANGQQKGNGYKSLSLTLESSILFNMKFYKTHVTQDMTAVFTFTDHYGKAHEVKVAGSEFVDEGNVWQITLKDLVVADASQLVTCTFLDANGNVVDGVYGVDSVESYCARAIAGNGGDYYEYIMKFCKAAFNYFH